MYSFRQRAKFAEEREKYQSKKTREEMLAEYLAVSEDFAKDDSSVDSVDSSINVDVPF